MKAYAFTLSVSPSFLALQAAESVTGPFYQPKTSAGEYARTIGEYAPAALAPGGGFLSSLLRFAVLPGLASETAGQLTKGSAAEPWIRALAGLAAAGPSAFLHLRPSRAAAETAETLSGHNPAPLATEVAENIGGQLPSEAVTARAETVAPRDGTIRGCAYRISERRCLSRGDRRRTGGCRSDNECRQGRSSPSQTEQGCWGCLGILRNRQHTFRRSIRHSARNYDKIQWTIESEDARRCCRPKSDDRRNRNIGDEGVEHGAAHPESTSCVPRTRNARRYRCW